MEASQSSNNTKASLNCECGYYTSTSHYMLDHLRYGQCEPSESHRELIKSRLRVIDVSLQAARTNIVFLESETTSLFKVLNGIRIPPKPADRRCNVCKAKTREMFGGVPQCGKHVAGGDVKVSSIIEELLYGKS